jgi:hypothetical protein
MEGLSRGFYLGASLTIHQPILGCLSYRSDEAGPRSADNVILDDGAIWYATYLPMLLLITIHLDYFAHIGVLGLKV